MIRLLIFFWLFFVLSLWCVSGCGLYGDLPEGSVPLCSLTYTFCWNCLVESFGSDELLLTRRHCEIAYLNCTNVDGQIYCPTPTPYQKVLIQECYYRKLDDWWSSNHLESQQSAGGKCECACQGTFLSSSAFEFNSCGTTASGECNPQCDESLIIPALPGQKCFDCSVKKSTGRSECDACTIPWYAKMALAAFLPPIIDKDNPSERASFKSCCDKHDDCYQTCGSSKDDCDKEFSSCMYAQCKASTGSDECVYVTGGDGRSVLAGPCCSRYAEAYTLGVTEFADGAFKDDQCLACKSCFDQTPSIPRKKCSQDTVVKG